MIIDSVYYFIIQLLAFSGHVRSDALVVMTV